MSSNNLPEPSTSWFSQIKASLSSSVQALAPGYSYRNRWDEIDSLVNSTDSYVFKPLASSESARIQGVSRSRGLRVLVIDGGGSMGVVPATILQEIEKQIAEEIRKTNEDKPAVPEVAGGMLALAHAHGRVKLSVLQRFFESGTAFATKYSTLEMRRLSAHGCYRVDRLEQAMDRLFEKSYTINGIGSHRLDQGEVGRKFRSLERDHPNSETRAENKRPKVFAITNPSDTLDTVILSNYPADEYSRYATLRDISIPKVRSDVSPAEATRATSAAPTYFPPKELPEPDENVPRRYYWDGGVVNNSPVDVGVYQSQMLYGPHQDFDLVLSIGCGISPEEQKKEKDGGRSVSLKSLATGMIANLTNSKPGFERAKQMLYLDPRFSNAARSALFRINPELSKKASIDSSNEIELKEIADEVRVLCMKEPLRSTIVSIAKILAGTKVKEPQPSAPLQNNTVHSFEECRRRAELTIRRSPAVQVNPIDQHFRKNSWIQARLPTEKWTPYRKSIKDWLKLYRIEEGQYGFKYNNLVIFLQRCLDEAYPPMVWATLVGQEGLCKTIEDARKCLTREFLYPLLHDLEYRKEDKKKQEELIDEFGANELMHIVHVVLQYDRANALMNLKYDPKDATCRAGMAWIKEDDRKAFERVFDGKIKKEWMDLHPTINGKLVWIVDVLDDFQDKLNDDDALLALQSAKQLIKFQAPQWMKDAYPQNVQEMEHIEVHCY